MTRSLLPALVVVAAGCHGKDQDDKAPPVPLTDTGWFDTETVEHPPPCEDRLVAWSPEAGEADWYYRDTPKVFVETDVHEAYDGWITVDDTGERLALPIVWDEDGVSFTFELPPGGLAGDTAYTMWLSDCEETVEVPFRTGALGVPLEIAPAELSGRTFLLELSSATWEEPAAALGALIAEYFTTPILLSVRYADGEVIDVLGAPGVVDEFGVVTQDPFADTWDFPIADFETAPFIEVSSEQIALSYEDIDVPVSDFLLQVTFSPDGSSLGGGVLSGLGDTRSVGELLPGGTEDSACNLAYSIGVDCIACDDGTDYCLEVRAVDLRGTWIPGLSLVER